MALSDVDRVSAIILAKSIVSNRALLDMRNETDGYVRRLYKYGIFTASEIAEFAGLTEYGIRHAISGLGEFRAKSGVSAKHLDHLVRMVGAPDFAKLHTRLLVESGATYAALARVTGLPESSLRRWGKKDRGKNARISA